MADAPALAETIALGLLQGPAELLPVSSSAHVEALPWLLGWRHAELSGELRKEVEVALHAGTAAALLLGARALPRPQVAALSFAPAAVTGLLLEHLIETRLRGPRVLAAGLLAGSALLVAADRADGARAAADAGAVDALSLGVAQACALVPGISRSGATTSAARLRGFGRAAAAELAREAALPVLVGAGALKGVRLARRRAGGETLGALAAGATAACASTLAALRARDRLAAVPLAVWAGERALLAAAILAVRKNRAQ